MAAKGGEILIARIDDQNIGFISYEVHSKSSRITGLFVDPAFQGKGLGNHLFEAALRYCERSVTVKLIVLQANERAKALYRKYGFEVTGVTEQSFYGAVQELMERKHIDI